ncbi:PilT domain protein [Methanomethylovorans hollandica DSM 15978]|uniref:PilT domain protein n=1 Tax=Methanomethylovorans hollandica (strain DSM 15978 / NBRC 107637 / DMS1) TaxID=867904 RepID=L0KTU1_METHD|nr:PilT domain protein [Methanomethylovorans hollandica]AGB48817.1 PilT domain protein [Methanomethylovorans hollandica DSM 15978]
MKVIIDTNALMIPVQFNLDIFSELHRLGFNHFIVPLAVLNELDRLVTTARGQDRIAAKVGRSLAQRCELVSKEGHADDIIVSLAQVTGAAVLTNDIGLKKRLIEMGIRVISLRQRNRLELLS